MKVNYFQLLPNEVTFYFYYVWQVVPSVLIIKWKTEYIWDRQLKG